MAARSTKLISRVIKSGTEILRLTPKRAEFWNEISIMTVTATAAIATTVTAAIGNRYRQV